MLSSVTIPAMVVPRYMFTGLSKVAYTEPVMWRM